MIEILQKYDCCGCSSCVQVCPKQCIVMQEDEEGFAYPKVDVSLCVDCHLCEKSCPVLNQSDAELPNQVFAATIMDQDILTKSSSGGIFSAFAEIVLQLGGVVYGAAFDEHWGVHHICVSTLEGLKDIRGSKYVQSNIEGTYHEAEMVLKDGRYVLFSGTPCQIAGLKKYLKKDYDILYCIDVICHGVPSNRVWREYLKSIPAKLVVGKNTVFSSLISLPVIKGINFRDKTYGWKKFGFSTSLSVDQQETGNSVDLPLKNHEYHMENIFMRGFLNNLYLRPSCYHCPARQGKSGSDIQLGDFWGVTRRYPDFYNENGVSLIMIKTKKGQDLFNEIKTKIKYIPATYDDVLDCNINVEKDEEEPINRALFFQSFNNEGITVIERFCPSIRKDGLLGLAKRAIKKALLLLKVIK